MSAKQISEFYPLSSLFIHSCGLEATPERIEALFKTLDVQFLPKIGELFALPADKIENFMSNVGAAPAPAAAVSTAAKEEAKVEEEEAKEEEAVDVEFDDLFG